MNNYGKKTSTEIRLQGFWGSDKGGADRAQGEPQESKRRNVYLDALLDGMSDTGIRIVTATAKEISEVEKEGE